MKLRDKIPTMMLDPEQTGDVLLAVLGVFSIFFLLGTAFFRLVEVLRG